jgi:16S rRNA A1518/A1519 N6-dimethyltransferase RsmA/KsgA/DIM1 with predicted DNA glycosylase/AP lyase activity
VSEPRARAARRPGSAHSQHFLRSQALAAELVRDSGVGPHDLVLDLGAGSGRLTAELALCGRHVVAVELDPVWAERLRSRWERVTVVRADAAAVELPREPFRIVANLPFDSTTAILRHLLDDPRVPLVRADLIVEWGVALKRSLPWPSTVNDVLWGAWYSTSLERRLPRSAFEPTPSVDAGVLVFERRARPLVSEGSSPAYRAFVAGGFRRGVRSVAPAAALRRLGLAGAAPRDLDAHQWAALFAALAPSRRRRSGARARSRP